MKASLFAIVLMSFPVAALSAGPSSAAVAPKRVQVTGIYTDMYVHREFGDILGVEIFLIYGGHSGYFALVQCAQGAPSKPVLVAAKAVGMQVELEPHTDPKSHCPQARFVGTITAEALRGSFEGTDDTLTLRRKKSFWQ